MKTSLIAQIAHAVLNALAHILTGADLTAWEAVQEDAQQRLLAAIQVVLDNPDSTPEQQHDAWLSARQSEGWTFADARDAEKKQSPLILPYAELPIAQKAKDYVLFSLVRSLVGLPDAEQAVADAIAEYRTNLPQASVTAGPVVVSASQVGVKYIGRRAYWEDSVYGTGLTFVAGQARAVPADIATKLLRHIDVFAATDSIEAAQDDTASQLAAASKEQKAKDERTEEFAVIDQINQMDKKGLVDYALAKFQVKLDTRKSVATLRTEVTQHVNQFGAA